MMKTYYISVFCDNLLKKKKCAKNVRVLIGVTKLCLKICCRSTTPASREKLHFWEHDNVENISGIDTKIGWPSGSR